MSHFSDRRNCYRQRNFKDYQQHREKSRVIFGVTIAAIGIIYLLRTLGFFHFSIEESWQVLLIIVGLLIGVKSSFRNHIWWILVLIGVANLTPEFQIMGHSSQHLVWPAALIVGGLAIALRPKRHVFLHNPDAIRKDTKINAEDKISIDVTFGGRKEIVTSKNFHGGEVSATFGGVELNLMQADTPDDIIVIDFKIAFGGVEVIVPSHWEVQNEISPTFGSVEDERTIQTNTTTEERKKLILRGNCSFANVEIKSY
jgi:hypothetical protein